MKTAILPVRLGRIASEPLSEEFRSFYLRVAELYFGSTVNLIGAEQNTVPISHHVGLNTDLIFQIFERVARIWDDDVHLVLVDLTNPPRELLPDHHIIGGILSLVDALRREGSVARFVVLVPVLLAKSDVSARALRSYIDRGDVALIANDGSSEGPVGKLDVEAYWSLLRKVREDDLSLFKKKMIRRLGHFKRRVGGRHDHCVPYFFDGSFCKPELIGLMRSFVADNFKGKKPVLMYHCEIATWLFDVVSALSYSDGLDLVDVRPILEGESSQVPERPLLVVPLIDTSKTLCAILARFWSISAQVEPVILAVMITGAEGDAGSTSIMMEGRSIKVNHFLSVERLRIAPEKCLSCLAGLPETAPNKPDEHLMLTSQGMWETVIEAGLKTEEDVPLRRQSLGWVPNFPRIVDRNAPYLAYKTEKLLQSIPGGLPVDPIIICPAEKGAQRLATWFEILSASLTTLFNYTLIEIPREAISLFEAAVGPENVEGFSETKEKWFVQLSSLSGKPHPIPVIVMDEFNASGMTRRGLARILRVFDLEVLCYLSLADLDPATASAFDAPVVSLYSIAWQSESQGGSAVLASKNEAEPLELACSYLLELLKGLPRLKVPTDKDRFREVVLKDLVTKSMALPIEVYRDVWARTRETLLPEVVQERLRSSGRSEGRGKFASTRDRTDFAISPRIKTDLVVITVIQTEFHAALRLFGIDPSTREEASFRGHKYYRASVQAGEEEIVVHITMIGQPRNVPCTNACRDVFEVFDVRACLLVGIAGGNRNKVKLGDVVAATAVLDLEGGRSELVKFSFGLRQRFQPRLETFNTPEPIGKYLEHLDPGRWDWASLVQKEIGACVSRREEVVAKALNSQPNFQMGVIMAGEKVLANGRLPKTAKMYHDKILAVDMEGSGFAAACRHCSVQWAVFRGISDYGDPQKADNWQQPAAIAAAAAAKIFLEQEYRIPGKEPQF